VHALLRIVLQKGNLNLQAHTPVIDVSARDAEGWITVKTERGTIRAKTVVHTTNRWASHLLPEFGNLILPDRGTIAAIKAPPGFIKRTGAQHWDAVVNVKLTDALFTIDNPLTKTELSSPAPSTLQHYHYWRSKAASCPQARRLLSQR
jgi:glycine/D-amino acid oxidase-like deaminating enzyme